MSRQAPTLAKPAAKLSNSYPNPLPPSLQSHPPSFPSNGKASSKSSYDTQLANWTTKNARAKAIIMSTLVPGSEPWQIAEPLEYAADIWKALEEKYGPKSEGMDENDGDSFPEEGSVEKNGEHQWQDKLTGKKPPANNGLAQEVSDGLQEVAELWTREQEKDAVVINATNSQSTEEKKKWNSDSMRDQRFLWALLNGGKEDETGRTNRKADHG